MYHTPDYYTTQCQIVLLAHFGKQKLVNLWMTQPNKGLRSRNRPYQMIARERGAAVLALAMSL
jgi:hypothetical protein